MERKIIFIGGIHGVGKSTMCNELSKKCNMAEYSCGTLIRKVNDKLLRKEDKRVHNINMTQNALIQGVKEFVQESNIILDGHFCLLNDSKSVERIPEYVFEELKPAIIIVLVRDAIEIEKSLLARDNIDYTYDILNAFQQKEILYAKELATKLNIPFCKYDVNNGIKELYEWISKNSNSTSTSLI